MMIKNINDLHMIHILFSSIKKTNNIKICFSGNYLILKNLSYHQWHDMIISGESPYKLVII